MLHYGWEEPHLRRFLLRVCIFPFTWYPVPTPCLGFCCLGWVSQVSFTYPSEIPKVPQSSQGRVCACVCVCRPDVNSGVIPEAPCDLFCVVMVSHWPGTQPSRLGWPCQGGPGAFLFASPVMGYATMPGFLKV